MPDMHVAGDRQVSGAWGGAEAQQAHAGVADRRARVIEDLGRAEREGMQGAKCSRGGAN